MGLIGFVFLVGLYFLPTIIGVARHKKNALAIGALNFFLGWSFIGWIVALVWALAADQPYQNVINVSQNVGLPYYPQQNVPYGQPPQPGYAPPPQYAPNQPQRFGSPAYPMTQPPAQPYSPPPQYPAPPNE